MKIVADESVDRPIVERLRADGHDVIAIVERNPGAPDESVLELANESEAILLTADQDFGELVFRLRQVSAGVALIRLSGIGRESKCGLVSELFRRRGPELADAFTVLTPGIVRIRPRAP